MKIRTRALALLLVVSFGASAAEDATPMGRVKDTVESVLATIRSDTLDPETRWASIREIIDHSFDFRSISQSVLATDWQRATSEQKDEFIKYFSRFLEETYRAKIEGYTGQEVRYESETRDGDRAVVGTVIVSGGTRTPVVYKLHRHDDGRWYGYDVVVEGVSLVNNYRTTFADIVKKQGVTGVIEDLKRRLEAFEKSILKPPARV